MWLIVKHCSKLDYDVLCVIKLRWLKNSYQSQIWISSECVAWHLLYGEWRGEIPDSALQNLSSTEYASESYTSSYSPMHRNFSGKQNTCIQGRHAVTSSDETYLTLACRLWRDCLGVPLKEMSILLSTDWGNNAESLPNQKALCARSHRLAPLFGDIESWIRELWAATDPWQMSKRFHTHLCFNFKSNTACVWLSPTQRPKCLSIRIWSQTETRLLAAIVPEAATAGTPMPGKVESPHRYKPVRHGACSIWCRCLHFSFPTYQICRVMLVPYAFVSCLQSLWQS